LDQKHLQVAEFWKKVKLQIEKVNSIGLNKLIYQYHAPLTMSTNLILQYFLTYTTSL